MQWVSCASSRLTVWLQGLKVRDLSSTPVSRAILETSCSGIRLQTWRKRLNRQRVGLIVFFFFIPAVWQVQNVKPTLFFIFCGMAVTFFHAWDCNGTRFQRFGLARPMTQPAYVFSPAAVSVAQTASLLYRRIPSCRTAPLPACLISTSAQPIVNRRYSILRNGSCQKVDHSRGLRSSR